MRRDDLVAYLDHYLEAAQGSDFGPNGLQVEGRPDITKVVTGVSSCSALFGEAARRQADAVLVHHGLFWDGMPRVLTGVMYRRVAKLIDNGVNLIAYHLPLDRHSEVGNNVLAARALGLTDLNTFAPHAGLDIGYYGTFQKPVGIEELIERCHAVFGQQPLHLPGGPAQLTTLGIVSGGAQKSLYDAIDAGLDAFITGEVSEWVMNIASEAGIHYLACGHYATERLGIRALGALIGSEHGLEVEFVDVANPV